MKTKNIYKSLIIIITFIIAFYGKQFINLSFDKEYTKIAYGYIWWIFPILLTTGILFGLKNTLNTLGISKNTKHGISFSIVTVLPMFLGYLFLGKINTEISLFELIYKTIFAGTFEELLFRGFLFGILFNKLQWKFIPASLIGAIIFGLAHTYQGANLVEVLGIFLVTFLGSIWFSWLYVKWNNNLWIPIFVHIAMNFVWITFTISDSGALGGYTANLFRVFTILLSIFLTLKQSEISFLKLQHQS